MNENHQIKIKLPLSRFFQQHVWKICDEACVKVWTLKYENNMAFSISIICKSFNTFETILEELLTKKKIMKNPK